jgi:hypothetical protein
MTHCKFTRFTVVALCSSRPFSDDSGGGHGHCTAVPGHWWWQVLSYQRTSPNLGFGTERRLKPQKPPLCSNLYDLTASDAAALPRPATALCSVSGRTGLFAKKFVTTDYDFAPTGVPGGWWCKA